MFTDNTNVPGNLLKKVSLVESFFNPLDTRLKKAYRNIWIEHFKSTRENFYKRLRRPNIEDFALILYFLEVNNLESSYAVRHYESEFSYPDGTPYPTYKEVKSFGLWK